jgi:hypothetical protein
MKINKRSIRKSAVAAVVTVLIGMTTACTDLWSEQHPGTFYISDGKTVATFLEEYEGNIFSDFIYILKKSINGSSYWGELKTYGDRTLFAPTNQAIREYLDERRALEKDDSKKWYFDRVENLPDSIIDSIRRTHLCKESIYLDDLRKNKDGTLPASNMLNRYLTYEAFEDNTDPNNPTVGYTINQFSEIIEPDDSTVNGVVHIISKVIRQSTEYLPGYLRLNNSKAVGGHKATIYLQALDMTKLSDLLETYRDLNYKEPQYDSTYACLEMTGSVKVHYSTGYQNYDNGQYQRVVWPNERLFKFTMFVVSDSVLDCVYGITDVDQENVVGKYSGKPGMSLKAKAKAVYNDANHLNDNDTLSTSPLYKFMAYHILPEWLERNLINFKDEHIVKHYKNACPDSIDMEDFYETLQRSVMRISTPYDKGSGNDGTYLYINRKGTVSAGNLEAEGIRIWNRDEVPEIDTEGAMNGGYYFVDSILVFDKHTKDALRTRLRFMGHTLSPDFINSGARGRMRQTLGDKPTTFAVYAFKDGYCTNVRASNQTLYVVRYQDDEWDIMYHDEMNIKGIFDIMFRLPPVPEAGTYEIRIFGNAQSDARYRKTRGIVQFYTHEGEPGANDDNWMNWSWDPCGIPVNMSIMTTDAKIGNILDSDIKGNTAEDKERNIQANDKAMRNRGYMKAPAGFAMGSKVSDRLRNHDVCFRKIVTTLSMDPGKDYYLRMRQVKEDPGSIAPMNILEIVPKAVYAGAIPEDRY